MGSLRGGDRRWKTALAVPALILTLLLALASTAAARTTPADPTTEYAHTFTYTGGEQELPVPAGLRHVQVEAIGGRGATKATEAGGFAAKVAGAVEVEGLDRLYLLVGGNAAGENGGYNGGGYGGSPAGTGAAVGGGGGGASDVRTMPGSLGGSSLLSRLLVAAGGGGAGALANSQSKLNAAGGNAGAAGERAESVGADNTLGFPYLSGTGNSGEDGDAGALGQGGEGGQGPDNSPPGWGGGGGGGLYGGGGGGGGSAYTGGAQPINTGGGGGGGGSSLVPTGGTSRLDENPSSAPQIAVSWAIPGTVMEGPEEYTNQLAPAYKLSSEDATGYECKLTTGVEVGTWRTCGAEGTITTIGAGYYVFEARAVNGEGNVDPTPASLEIIVEIAPPVIIEVNGPTTTPETQPTFTFLGGSIIPVHFQCAFDGAAPGPCSGEHSDRPSSPLRAGSHTFAVTPIDAAGNVGEAKIKSFTVEGITPKRGPPSPSPRLTLAKPVVNKKNGTATILAAVNGAGSLALKGPDVKPTVATASAVGKVKLTIAAVGKARKQLGKTGKAKVTATVTFTSFDGTASAITKVTLHKPVARHRRR
jgi:hypothetical protein